MYDALLHVVIYVYLK